MVIGCDLKMELVTRKWAGESKVVPLTSSVAVCTHSVQYEGCLRSDFERQVTKCAPHKAGLRLEDGVGDAEADGRVEARVQRRLAVLRLPHPQVLSARKGVV